MTKLFVSNFPYDFNESDLKDLIIKKGFNPTDVYIVKN